MRILYFSPHPFLNLSDPSGYGTHMREVIFALRKKGHTVETCIIGGEKPDGSLNFQINSSKKKWVKHFLGRAVWQLIRDFRFYLFSSSIEKKLIKSIEEHKPELIYERGCYMLNSGASIAKKYSIQYYLELNAPLIQEKIELQYASLFDFLAEKHLKQQLAKCDKLIVVSSSLKNFYKNYISSDKIVVTPNAINPDNLRINPALKTEIQAKFKITDNDIIIGFVGSIFPYHGVDKIISALPSLSSNLKLLIVGGGEIIPQLKNQASSLNILERVIFVGNVGHSEVFTYLNLMHITLLPHTKSYCSPVKIFEYGAAGKAIVSVDEVGVSDVMQNNLDGLLFEPGNKDEMINKIKLFVLDKPLRDSCATHFQDKVLKQYTWDKVIDLIFNN